MFKKIFLASILLACFLGAGLNTLQAQPINKDVLESQTSAFRGEAGLSEDASVGEIAATAIKAFLGLLGVIFIILIIHAGFKWMTARGNEDQVKEAKDSLRRAVIGIIIIAGAYAITFFVFEAMNEAVGDGGGIDTKAPPKAD